jgi:hypothetical protein
VATWLRAAAGSGGLREVSRRVLGRLRAIPSALEAARVLDTIESEGRLATAARSLAAKVGESSNRPRALLDAVLAWVVRESESVTPARARPAVRLSAGARDYLLIASTLALALTYL